MCTPSCYMETDLRKCEEGVSSQVHGFIPALDIWRPAVTTSSISVIHPDVHSQAAVVGILPVIRGSRILSAATSEVCNHNMHSQHAYHSLLWTAQL